MRLCIVPRNWLGVERESFKRRKINEMKYRSHRWDDDNDDRSEHTACVFNSAFFSLISRLTFLFFYHQAESSIQCCRKKKRRMKKEKSLCFFLRLKERYVLLGKKSSFKSKIESQLNGLGDDGRFFFDDDDDNNDRAWQVWVRNEWGREMMKKLFEILNCCRASAQ